MKKFALGNHLTRYLLIVCVLLTGILLIENSTMLRTPADGDQPLEQQPSAVARITRENFTAPGISAYREITERPLFTADRQPPPEPDAAPAVAVEQSPLRLELEGVAITPEASIVLVRDLASNKLLRLGKGMQHQGWEVTAVTANGATFKRGAVSQEVLLRIDDAPKRVQQRKPATSRTLPRPEFREFFNGIKGVQPKQAVPPETDAPAEKDAAVQKESREDAAPAEDAATTIESDIRKQ